MEINIKFCFPKILFSYYLGINCSDPFVWWKSTNYLNVSGVEGTYDNTDKQTALLTITSGAVTGDVIYICRVQSAIGTTAFDTAVELNIYSKFDE